MPASSVKAFTDISMLSRFLFFFYALQHFYDPHNFVDRDLAVLFFVGFFCASDQIIQAYLQDITDPAQHLQSDPAAAMLDITQVCLRNTQFRGAFSL